jgi:hypothetical protein
MTSFRLLSIHAFELLQVPEVYNSTTLRSTLMLKQERLFNCVNVSKKISTRLKSQGKMRRENLAEKGYYFVKSRAK